MLGSISTPAKAQAARENAKLGGWPKGKKRGKYKCSKCGKKFPTVEKCLIHKITCGAARRQNNGLERTRCSGAVSEAEKKMKINLAYGNRLP